MSRLQQEPEEEVTDSARRGESHRNCAMKNRLKFVSQKRSEPAWAMSEAFVSQLVRPAALMF